MSSALSRLERLPDELLLQIASELGDHDLATCSRVSRKVRSIAQDKLYRVIDLGGHCFVSGAVKTAFFVRTLIERPDLAQKVDSLQFFTARQDVGRELENHGLRFGEIQQLALVKLDELGYEEDHPWHRMMSLSINSALGGLLLALVPNLTDLQFGVYDNHHGLISSEPFLAMYGTPAVLECAVPIFQNLKELSISAEHMPILYLDMPNLTLLMMNKLTTMQVCRLNGLGSLKGALKLKELKLELVAQIADAELMDALKMSIADLLDAMGNPALTTFNAHLWSESFTHGHPSFDAHFLLVKGLEKVASSIEHLEIYIRHDCAHGDGEFILDHTTKRITSLKSFTSLKRLCLPFRFLALPDYLEQPDAIDIDIEAVFPTSVVSIEVIYPQQSAVEFLRNIISKPEVLPLLEKIHLVCSEEMEAPAYKFWASDILGFSDTGLSCTVADHDTGETGDLGCKVGIDLEDDEDMLYELDDLPDLEEPLEIEGMD